MNLIMDKRYIRCFVEVCCFFVVILVIIDTWRVMSLERGKQTDRVVGEIVERTSIPEPVLSAKIDK